MTKTAHDRQNTCKDRIKAYFFVAFQVQDNIGDAFYLSMYQHSSANIGTVMYISMVIPFVYTTGVSVLDRLDNNNPNIKQKNVSMVIPDAFIQFFGIYELEIQAINNTFQTSTE